MTRDLGGCLPLYASAIFAAVGNLAADWNAPHNSNPNWSPHAEFFNARTLATRPLLALPGAGPPWAPLG